MRVRTELGPQGARAAAARGDVVVLVDALRSSVTITVALAVGTRQVVPIASVNEARSYLGKPGVLVAGEQGGIAVADFDYGNSPTQLLADAARLRGQVLILATSNGTPLVRAAVGAVALLAGSLPNASAVVGAALRLAHQAGSDVTLLAAGGGGRPVIEDDYAAALLAKQGQALGQDEQGGQVHAEHRQGGPPAGRLELEGADRAAGKVFAAGRNGQKLTSLGYAADVALCARLDVFSDVGIFDGEGFVLWKTG